MCDEIRASVWSALEKTLPFALVFFISIFLLPFAKDCPFQRISRSAADQPKGHTSDPEGDNNEAAECADASQA